ncbi:MAG: META and DUF4377 domain-containing protein [Burkholderiales bacterium]
MHCPISHSGAHGEVAGSRRAALLALLLSGIPAFAQSGLEGRWALDDLTVPGSMATDPPTQVTLTIQQNRLGASAGCNRAHAAFEDDGKRLKVGTLASTMMACPPELAKLERRLFDLLERNPSYTVDGDTLKLRSAGDALAFKRMPSPSARAVKKLIYVAAERKDCTGVAPMKCFQVREEKTDPWTLFYGEIVGFDPKPGIEYRLRILEDTVPNPPVDASSKRWYLDLVVEQKVVTPQ